MVKRKVNRVGTSTLTVSLPSKWAQKYGLKPGCEVDVIEDDGRLLINTEGVVSTPKKVSIHLKKGQPFLRRYLNVMYKDGYDEIELISEDPLDQKLLKEAITMMLGFELVEAHPTHIIVRNIATPNESEFDNIFNRLFLLNLTMAKSLLEDFKTGKTMHTNEIEELEATTNKFFCFCQRVLIRKDIKNRAMSMNLYFFTAMLEIIADDLKRISRIRAKETTKISKPVTQILEKSIGYLQHVYECFYKPDTLKVTGLRKERDRLFEEIYELFDEKGISRTELKITALILSVLTHIKDIETEIYHL